MKMLHLADLHIGRRLNGISLMEDQQVIIGQILQMAEECHCVLLAGDLFDKAQPSAESLKMVSGLLVALSRRGKPVLAVSGNHDNGEQLAYCHKLLRDCGVYISPAYEGEMYHQILEDEYGPVHFWLLPFIKPGNVRGFHPEVGSTKEAVAAALANAPVDDTQRNVLVMHQFVAGGAVCQSESLAVGGLDQVGAELLTRFDYVALGHLHSPQRLLGGRACYAGSPLKYSLSEERHHKAALMVTLGEKGQRSVESRPFHPLRELRTLRGSLRELTQGRSDDFIQAVVTDDEALLDPIGSLRLSYPHLIGMSLEAELAGAPELSLDIQAAEALSPLEHFTAFYQAQHGGQAMGEGQLAVLRQIIQQAQEVENAPYQA